MSDSREAAIRFLANKARENSGIQTDEQRQRQAAVDFLTGKQVREPLRPEANALAQFIRRSLS